jgi:hypothetical protein
VVDLFQGFWEITFHFQVLSDTENVLSGVKVYGIATLCTLWAVTHAFKNRINGQDTVIFDCGVSLRRPRSLSRFTCMLEEGQKGVLIQKRWISYAMKEKNRRTIDDMFLHQPSASIQLQFALYKISWAF